MRRALIILTCLTVLVFWPSRGLKADCGEDCDSEYESDADSCHLLYGDSPRESDDYIRCIRNAKDSYRSCLSACAD